MELVKQNYWWPGIKEDIKNMFKDILNVNKTKSNNKGNMENYTYWRYCKDISKKSALISLDYYLNQMEKMLL